MANYANTRVRLEESSHILDCGTAIRDADESGCHGICRGLTSPVSNPKDKKAHLIYAFFLSEAATSGRVVLNNRHLNSLVESNIVNVGDRSWAHRPAVGRGNLSGVGAFILLGGRESRPHGEGRQREGTPN